MQCNHIGIMASKVQPTKAHPQSLSSLPTLALGGTSASDLQPMEKLLHSFMATLPQPSTPVPHHLHWLQVTASLFRWLWALAPHLENKDQQGTHLTGSGE